MYTYIYIYIYIYVDAYVCMHKFGGAPPTGRDRAQRPAGPASSDNNIENHNHKSQIDYVENNLYKIYDNITFNNTNNVYKHIISTN